MRNSQFNESGLQDDPITPASIQHKVDEYSGDRFSQDRYNYLVYRFVLGEAEMIARCYLHDAGEISLLGPFELTSELRPPIPIEAPELRQAVIQYLTRRFDVITELWPESQCGYQPIWMVMRPRWMRRDEPWPPGWRGLPPNACLPQSRPEAPPSR